MLHPSGCGQELQPGRWHRAFFRPLEPFIAHPLSGQFVEAAFDPPAQFDRFVGRLQIETTGELHAAQHAQGVFHKRRAGVPQNSSPQIRRAAKKIEHLPRARIEHEGVNREIAPRRRLRGSDVRVQFDGETFVAGGDFGVPSRDGEIITVFAARGQFDHAERSPHPIHFSPARQALRQGFVADAKHLHVEILAGTTEQPIPHATAHQPGPLQFGRLAENALQFWRHEIHRAKLA